MSAVGKQAHTQSGQFDRRRPGKREAKSEKTPHKDMTTGFNY